MARVMGQRGGLHQRLQLIADLYIILKLKTSSEQVSDGFLHGLLV